MGGGTCRDNEIREVTGQWAAWGPGHCKGLGTSVLALCPVPCGAGGVRVGPEPPSPAWPGRQGKWVSHAPSVDSPEVAAACTGVRTGSLRPNPLVTGCTPAALPFPGSWWGGGFRHRLAQTGLGLTEFHPQGWARVWTLLKPHEAQTSADAT